MRRRPTHNRNTPMAQGDLVTLSDLKAYLGGDLQSNDDVVLTRLISAASAFFTTACACPILSQSLHRAL